MIFADMVTEVYTITNRADLAAETALALRKATLKMHGVDFWARDLAEVALVIAPAAANVQIDIPTSLPNLRAVAYIRDAATGVPAINSRMFQHIEPRAALDEYFIEKYDVWYQGGNNINIKSSLPISNLVVGYYKNPTVSPLGSYSSWIANEQPYVLIEEAAATIFKMTGNAEMARFYDQQSAQNIALLRQNYLEGVAR